MPHRIVHQPKIILIQFIQLEESYTETQGRALRYHEMFPNPASGPVLATVALLSCHLSKCLQHYLGTRWSRRSIPVSESSLTALIYMVIRAAGQQLPHGRVVATHTHRYIDTLVAMWFMAAEAPISNGS